MRIPNSVHTLQLGSPFSAIRVFRGLLRLLLVAFACLCAQAQPNDVLIYGATPGGIAAAVAAAKSGQKVTLVEPSARIGGLVTDLFPKLAELADGLGVIRSMTTKVNEHAQGNYGFHTGFPFFGHPSAHAWISYRLGTGNQNLPGFVVLQSGGAVAPHGGVGLFSSGYLPAQHQASILRVDEPAALPNLRPRESDALQRRRLDFVRSLDEPFARASGEAAVESAIRNYETAYRMQTAVPELWDIRGKSEATKKLYGLDSPHKQCAA